MVRVFEVQENLNRRVYCCMYIFSNRDFLGVTYYLEFNGSEFSTLRTTVLFSVYGECSQLLVVWRSPG